MSTVMKRYAVRVVAVVLCITMFTACNRYQDTDTTTTQAANQASTDPGAESSEPGSNLLPDRFESGGEDETGNVMVERQVEIKGNLSWVTRGGLYAEVLLCRGLLSRSIQP